jgi:YfiH family protein
MILQEKEGVQWLEFEQLRQFPHLVHGVFLRKGGVSEKSSLASLNVGGRVNDLPEHVTMNRKKIRECLGMKTLVIGDQRHEFHIHKIFDIEPKEEIFLPYSADGLFTTLKDVLLATYHADCQVGLFYDPKREVIANIHCGWRGNVQNIFGKTVEMLQQQMGSNPKDLLVCISPSLGPSHAEFIHYEKELPASFYPYQTQPTYFDLWEISYQQLRSSGVRGEHIEIARMCTYSQPELFFSYRREKDTGRNATVIGFKDL